MQSHNSLDFELIDVIFTKLTLAYGRDFLARWEGLEIADVKSDWAHELSGMSADSVRHALRHLPPSKPPTVYEFRNIAVNAPQPVFQRIDPPRANPEIVKAALAKARSFMTVKPA